MIKSKDLRIGDLVHVNHSPILPEKSVCTIDSIYATTSFKTEHVNLILTKQDWRLGTWYCNDIDGIPIDSLKRMALIRLFQKRNLLNLWLIHQSF